MWDIDTAFGTNRNVFTELNDHRSGQKRLSGMLLVIAILLLLFWVGGFAFHVAGGLIHILIVIAVILFILHFVRGRSV
jgi:hypothetical protein